MSGQPLGAGPAYEPSLFDVPVLPYPDGPDTRSSGWSGSTTSHERARHDDTTGETTERQQRVLRYLSAQGADGAIWKELASAFGWHHGQASGALSVLHKDGQIARLAEVRRSRCAVYVLPQHVHGRATAEQGRQRRPSLLLDHAADVLTDHEPEWWATTQQMVCTCGYGGEEYSHHLLAMLAKVATP